MKTSNKTNLIALAAVVLAFNLQPLAFSQGTAFTYQGRLNLNGAPASGSYDLTFALFATNTTGTAIAGPVTNVAVGVSNGLFTTTVDFGAAFTGASNWLEIAVSTNGANAFSRLAPRQQLTPTPYALYAQNANSLGGTLSASQLTSIGNGNFFVGPSGNATTGGYNTAYGVDALFFNTSGFENTANGYQALFNNTSGFYNTANGVEALLNNTIGYLNTANGFEALMNNTSGFENTANGSGALLNNTIGSYNTANGYAALLYNTNGSYNTANGFEALYANTSGNNNTANGVEALYANTSGFNNTANGVGALYYNASGSDNTANGFEALSFNTSGSYNTANGVAALFNNTSGSYNIALGYQAGLNIKGSGNIDIGNQGLITDTNIIRIGDGQTQTFIAGVINGAGLVTSGNLGVGTNDSTVNVSIAGVANYNSGLKLTGNSPNGTGLALNNTSSGGHQFSLFSSGTNNSIGAGGFAIYDDTMVRWCMVVTSQGNVGMDGALSPTNPLVVGSAYCTGSQWQNSSDVNKKTDFSSIKAQDILEKVAALPITEWSYTNETGTLHLGPMAQDFMAAFHLGADEKSIGTIDENGVALAAIQGLNQKLEAQKSESTRKDIELRKLAQQNERLAKRLEELEQAVRSLTEAK